MVTEQRKRTKECLSICCRDPAKDDGVLDQEGSRGGCDVSGFWSYFESQAVSLFDGLNEEDFIGRKRRKSQGCWSEHWMDAVAINLDGEGAAAAGLGWDMRGLVQGMLNLSCLLDIQVEMASRQFDM